MAYPFEFIISIGGRDAILVGFGGNAAATISAGNGRAIKISCSSGSAELVKVTVDGRSGLYIDIIRRVNEPAFGRNIYAIFITDGNLTGSQNQAVTIEYTGFGGVCFRISGTVVSINGCSSIRIFLSSGTDIISSIWSLGIPCFGDILIAVFKIFVLFHDKTPMYS
jgi:hypothetical protein